MRVTRCRRARGGVDVRVRVVVFVDVCCYGECGWDVECVGCGNEENGVELCVFVCDI